MRKSALQRRQEEFLNEPKSHNSCREIEVDKAEIFLWNKKDLAVRFSFVFLLCSQIATSYRHSIPCNNIHLEVELRTHLQSY